MSQDNFTILEQISESPTTSVYKAHQNVLGRIILLKVLHKHLLRDKELVARFSREAKACAILKSENIVQVYDLTTVDGAPAIVMEYVEGKSLEDVLEDKNVRSEELLSKVAVSVLKALSYAHDRGVTHRDIKPGNILVSDDGTIKVTDFGLAAVSDSPSLTMEGSLIGTPAYMSPEQARGEAVDHRTDLFSLGVTLVEVLTGDKILAGRSYAECISKIQSFSLDSINYLAPLCSPHTFEFLKHMVAPDKHDRFASANEALQFLGEPAGVEGITPEFRATGRRKKTKLLFAGAIVALLILVVGLSSVLRHPALKVANVSPDSTVATNVNVPSGKKIEPPPEERTKSVGKIGNNTREIAMRDTTAKLAGDTTLSAKIDNRQTTVAVARLDSGLISIRCRPWAKIYIDNEYAGTTPIAGSIPVPIGTHTVTFSNPDFAPIVKQVNVRKNLLAAVDANFLEYSGYLIVSVRPWGKIYVDDQYRETTPWADPIIVSAGTRKIRIQNPNFPDIVKTVTVDPGDTLRLDFNFHSADGK